MLRTNALIVAGLASLTLAATVLRPSEPQQAGKALLVIAGPQSEIRAARRDIAKSQDVFDGIWNEHMGERVTKAAQGWPLTPKIDFDACCAIFVFGGDSTNSNGYRVVDVISEADAVTVRYESDSYQTASFDGPDHGNPSRPWAMFFVPATDKTILLEENVQGLIGGPPIWKQTAAFPGLIGVGRPVPGTQQKGQSQGRALER